MAKLTKPKGHVYGFFGKYEWLSNFYPAPCEIKSRLTCGFIIFPTVEHAFQAQKVTNVQDLQKIINAPTPSKAKVIGRKVKLRSDWDEIKDTVMYECVLSKFKINTALRLKLIETKGELVELNTWGDTYWGAVNIDGDVVGKNMLGNILQLVRQQIWDGVA
jgi:ribA/ribD-fused uncharacterized protein